MEEPISCAILFTPEMQRSVHYLVYSFDMAKQNLLNKFDLLKIDKIEQRSL